MQILASAYGKSLLRVDAPETAARGPAVLAFFFVPRRENVASSVLAASASNLLSCALGVFKTPEEVLAWAAAVPAWAFARTVAPAPVIA